MAATQQFLNAKRAKVCQHDNIEGQLFCKRVVTGDAETLYGYVVHPSTWESRGKGKPRHKLTARKRCYVGRLSRYFTGRRCINCNGLIHSKLLAENHCSKCRAILKQGGAVVVG